MFTFSAFLILLLVGLLNGQSVVKRERVIDRGSDLLVCKQEPIELGIVFDSSRSISHDDFQRGKDFLQEFLDQFEIGDGRNVVRVSIITFGKGIYPKDGFNLTTFNNKEDLLNAIKHIPHRAGPYTSTGEGIEYMHLHQLNPTVARPYAAKVGLVITDGNSQRGRFTAAQAKLAREDNITMFALGIGNKREVKASELLNIAGDKDRVTRVDNYSSLSSVKKLLATKTCIKTPKPSTPASLKDEPCGKTNPADIDFVFSPADHGIDGTAWTTTFISHVLKDKGMEVGFQYGVISGDCPDDAGFSLDKYSHVDDIKEHLLRYDRLQLPVLAQHAFDYGFSSSFGARQNANKVVVLFANGKKVLKASNLGKTIRELKDSGVRVFIANPDGYPIEFEGAKALQGSSSIRQAVQLLNILCPNRCRN